MISNGPERAIAVLPAAKPEPPRDALIAALGPGSARAVQDRLERILLDDRELLISLQCQLEQIRREMRLLNDDRIVQALGGRTDGVRH